MENQTYAIFTFANTHQAIHAQKCIEIENEKFIVLPTPTIIHKACGIAVLCAENEAPKIKSLLSTHMQEEKDFTLHHLQFLGKGRWQVH